MADSAARFPQTGTWFLQSDSFQVWTDNESGLSWLFGMHWTPTLDRRSRRIFFEQLREQGVRWYATSGKAGELIGVSVDAAAHDLPSHTLCAALAFANQRPDGTHLLLLRYGDTRQWIVGSHQGQVISQTDRWIDYGPLADALILELQRRFKDLTIERIEIANPMDLRLSELLPWIATDAKKLSRLRKVPGLGRARKVVISGGFVILLVLGWILYHAIFKSDLQSRRELGNQLDAPPEELAQKPPLFEIHGPEALMGLVNRLEPLPVDPPGWQLQGIDCNLLSQQSHCQARYQRVSRQSDNSQLARFAPPGWSIGVLGLDETLLEISIPIKTDTIQIPLTSQDSGWMVALQRHTQRTPFIDLGQTQTIERMGYRIRYRSITMRLPIRQKERLADWQLPVRWSTLRLDVFPQATLDSYSGSLMLNLRGELLVAD